MPKSFTIHGLDTPVAKRLEMYASRENKSINQAAKTLLAIALGVEDAPKVRRENGLRRFRGRIAAREAGKLLKFVETSDFSKVDKEDL